MRALVVGLMLAAGITACLNDVPAGPGQPIDAPALSSGSSGGGSLATLAITTTSLPNGNVGTNYANYVTSSGGQGTPHEFRIISGRLPSGLQMAKSFGVLSTVISGTPTTVETTTFTVQVRDKAGNKATKILSITIDPPRTLVITTPGPALNPATLGQSYFANLFADGGATPYSWSIVAGQLPPGLRLTTSPGRINGTPTARGTFAFTVRVQDKGGQQASQQFSITVN